MTSFPFTHVVITASNETQARGYRACITDRKKVGLLPRAKFSVIADPGNVRVGSGAATFHAIRELHGTSGLSLREFLRSSRVLILHSGGDSKRLPAYAAQGKLFLPLPRIDEYGNSMTLFDVILSDMSSLKIGDRGRVVIAAGDLSLNLAGGTVCLSETDIVGISCRTEATVGTRHGVYVLNRKGLVKDFLQKPSIEDMKRFGAVGDDGLVHADTGVISLSAQSMMALVRAYERSIMPFALQGGYAFDVYEHVMIAIAGRISAGQYARALGKNDEHRSALISFHQAMPELRTSVAAAEHIRFKHVGSTREVLERLGKYFSDTEQIKSVCMHSVLGHNTRLHGNCVIDACVFSKRASLPGRNLIVGVPAQLKHEVVLPKGIGIAVLPIGRSKWTVIAFGDRDDCKTPFARGGTLLNKKHHEAPGTAWDIPLWHIGNLESAFTHTMSVIHRGATGIPKGHSLASLLPLVNHSRLFDHRRECVHAARIADPQSYITRSNWLSAMELAKAPRDNLERRHVVNRLLRSLHTSVELCSARTLYNAATVARRIPSNSKTAERLEHRAFESIRTSLDAMTQPTALVQSNPISLDQLVWATSPARIDLFGGWSDTPPICTDLGGAVVNAAASLNGQYPLQAICRSINEPHIRLNSIDLGGSILIKHANDWVRSNSPLNWSALPMAALAMTGFRPPRGMTLRKHLERFGGGLEITVFSALPKGSGLGASSILGATLIGALLRFSGHTTGTSRIISLTSALEQYMSTGGGWQDQVGGITPGVKLLKTEPGVNQIPLITQLASPNAFTSRDGISRCVLYYTGRTRLAKNILRTVVGRYLGREREVRSIIDRLKCGAFEMADAIRSGDLDHCGRMLREYWSLKKQLDPGSTNTEIEALFDHVKPHISGGTLLGAGGGGFAFFVSKSETATTRLRESLCTHRGNSRGRIYDFAIDDVGMNISVL